jgi:hypothetical protein
MLHHQECSPQCIVVEYVYGALLVVVHDPSIEAPRKQTVGRSTINDAKNAHLGAASRNWAAECRHLVPIILIPIFNLILTAAMKLPIMTPFQRSVNANSISGVTSKVVRRVYSFRPGVTMA